MILEILSSKIIHSNWTDHCEVYTTIASLIPRSQDTTWHINDTMLTHPFHRLEIEKALTEYFLVNDTADVSDLTVWEGHKTVVQGKLIQQASAIKRTRKVLFAKLDAKFNSCHLAFQSCPTATNNAKLDKARLDLDLFLTDSAERLMCKRQHTQYLKANKPDTYMARSLNAIKYAQTPIRLKTSRDAYTSKLVTILEVFCSNLAKLYSNISDFDQMKADTLFATINLPTIDNEQLAHLLSPITEFEVKNAIKTLKPHK